jgi:hypothetical protein
MLAHGDAMKARNGPCTLLKRTSTVRGSTTVTSATSAYM